MSASNVIPLERRAGADGRARHPAGRAQGQAGYTAELYLHDRLIGTATFRSEAAAETWAAWQGELAGAAWKVVPDA